MDEETLDDKLNAITEAMTEYPGFPETKSEMAEQIGMDPGNLSSILTGRRQPSEKKLTDTLTKLHRTLRLKALGIEFSIAWWTEKTTKEIQEDIRAARNLDLLEAMDQVLAPEAFFDFERDGSSARIFLDHGASPAWAKIANKPVFAKERLKLCVNPPSDGFLKTLVFESGLVVSTDDYFGLLRRRFKAGVKETLEKSFPVSPVSPEALFVGLMQPEPFTDRGLPSDLNLERAITPQGFVEWLRDQAHAKPKLHVAAMRLFLSTGEPQ